MAELFVDLGRALAQLGDPRFLRVLLGSLALTVAGAGGGDLGAWSAGVGWLLPEQRQPALDRADRLRSTTRLLGGGRRCAGAVGVPDGAGRRRRWSASSSTASPRRSRRGTIPACRRCGALEPRPAGRRTRCASSGWWWRSTWWRSSIYLLVAPLAPLVFWLVNGFLLGREYFQLVAMRRLGPDGAAALRRRHFWRIWLAGTPMAVPLSVPVVNLLVPIAGWRCSPTSSTGWCWTRLRKRRRPEPSRRFGSALSSSADRRVALLAARLALHPSQALATCRGRERDEGRGGQELHRRLPRFRTGDSTTCAMRRTFPLHAVPDVDVADGDPPQRMKAQSGSQIARVTTVTQKHLRRDHRLDRRGGRGAGLDAGRPRPGCARPIGRATNSVRNQITANSTTAPVTVMPAPARPGCR